MERAAHRRESETPVEEVAEPRGAHLGTGKKGKKLGPRFGAPETRLGKKSATAGKKSAHPSPITTFCWDLGLGLVDLHTARKNLQGDSIDVPVAHEWSSSQRQTSPEPVDSLPSINTLSKFC